MSSKLSAEPSASSVMNLPRTLCWNFSALSDKTPSLNHLCTLCLNLSVLCVESSVNPVLNFPLPCVLICSIKK